MLFYAANASINFDPRCDERTNVMKTTINYTLSQAALEREYIETGKRSFSQKALVINDEELTPDQRQILLPYKNAFGVSNVYLNTFEFVPPSKSVVGVSEARKNSKPVVFEAAPSIEEAFEHIQRMTAENAEIQRQIEASKPEYERLKKLLIEERAERELQQQLEKERKHQEKIEAKRQAALIPWKENGTAIVNLYECVFAASLLERDNRFNAWVRRIESIDPTANNGYCFVGPWIQDKTIEIKRGETMVLLVAAATGSRRSQTTEYRVVVLDESGILQLTDIATDDTDRGWALRIRDDIAKLLG
jgi:DNA-binding FrmR family transcriptional regulator